MREISNYKAQTETFLTSLYEYYLARKKISPLVYLDDASGEMINEKAVMVIAPSLYWALRVTLNVKSEKEAAAYAPALFDLGEGYRYEAQKIDTNVFVLIAYDPIVLSQRYPTLFEGSTPFEITFAQWVFGDINTPIRLKNQKYLALHDGIVMEFEECYLDTSSAIDISEALRQTNRYKTIRTQKIISTALSPKTLKMTLLILILLLINISTDAVTTYQSINELRERNEALLNEYHLGSTSIEREAILNALKQKEIKQRELRQHCFTLSTFPIKGSKKSPSLPPLPPVPLPSSSEGIVLIPGSKPGEPNRLLVGGGESKPLAAQTFSGLRELSFDGKSTKIVIETAESEKLQKLFRKHFKNCRIEHNQHQLEVRIK
jgi:hypothetical protein